MKFEIFIMKVQVILVLLALSCTSIAQIKNPIPVNPTVYTYTASIDEVQQAIMGEFSNMPGYRYMRLEHPSKEIILSSIAKQIFENYVNRNDFYLHYSRPIGKSEMYLNKDGQPLEYYADFHIHITEVDSNQTTVEINTINPYVVIGRELLPSLPHFVRKDKTKPVLPSTIEEYEILLRIGQAVKESGMPKIKK